MFILNMRVINVVVVNITIVAKYVDRFSLYICSYVRACTTSLYVRGEGGVSVGLVYSVCMVLVYLSTQL